MICTEIHIVKCQISQYVKNSILGSGIMGGDVGAEVERIYLYF
jgi:hypothetical protein